MRLLRQSHREKREKRGEKKRVREPTESRRAERLWLNAFSLSFRISSEQQRDIWDTVDGVEIQH
jgi:hypothetical protein